MQPYANSSTSNRAQRAAQALTSALSNPYQYTFHYAQAYYRQQQACLSSNPPLTTPDGYSLSSTYAPSLPPRPEQARSQEGRPSSHGTHGSRHSRGGRGGFHNQQTHWFEPGNYRCTHGQCSFSGSEKSVEIHMMDRHLIYPPGWEKRKRKDDWDADPSLKGKKIPIQGTNFVLDTPEAIESWIAERKKRWPTASRVQEKETKLKEALDRGEIFASRSTFRGQKRPREDESGGQLRGRGRGRGHTLPLRTATIHPLPKKPVTVVPSKTSECTDDDSSSSGSDVDPEKDAISSKPPPGPTYTTMEETINTGKIPEKPKSTLAPVIRRPARHPKPPPSQRNPFGNRPSLLRNLLLPEIRMTVSNLSQAIHFLVENDFLQDVELNPGDADDRPIEVVGETNNEIMDGSLS